MKLTPEQLKRLTDRRKREMLGRGRSPYRLPTPLGRPVNPGKKIVLHGGTGGFAKKSGLDAPLSQTQNIAKALSQTQKVNGGQLAEALKSTYELGFPDHALMSLRTLSEHGMAPLCFTLEGIASCPFLFLADLTVYSTVPDIFEGLARRPYNADETMEYAAATFSALSSETELWTVFSKFESNDKGFFLQAVKEINLRREAGLPNDFVYFIGHDKRRAGV